MRARYNYSYRKENGDLQSRKQCFGKGKTTCKNYRENVHKKKGGCARTTGRMCTNGKQDTNKAERECAQAPQQNTKSRK